MLVDRVSDHHPRQEPAQRIGKAEVVGKIGCTDRRQQDEADADFLRIGVRNDPEEPSEDKAAEQVDRSDHDEGVDDRQA